MSHSRFRPERTTNLASDIFPLHIDESKTFQVTRGHKLKIFPKQHRLKMRECFFFVSSGQLVECLSRMANKSGECAKV